MCQMHEADAETRAEVHHSVAEGLWYSLSKWSRNVRSYFVSEAMLLKI